MTQPLDPRLARQIDTLAAPRRARVRAWFDAHATEVAAAQGSGHNHQAWPGGFLDHTLQLLASVDLLLDTLPGVHPLPADVTADSAKTVLLFHDVEKVFKYGGGLLMDFGKTTYLFWHLPREWGITFTAAEVNALNYVHGEGDHYRKDRRVMGPLAAFVHSCDVLSARVWHDRGAPDSCTVPA